MTEDRAEAETETADREDKMVDLTERKESHEEMMWRHRSWSSRRASVIRRKIKNVIIRKRIQRRSLDGKGKKAKTKQVAEVKRPQPKEEKKEEKIKQIVIPEVLTIKELADKMKIVPSVIVKNCSFKEKL